MLKLKNKNGITLIALIITIIVMLILVGVTVSTSLNGGLFNSAKDAASQTEIAAEMESLQAAAYGAIGSSGKIDDPSKIKLPTGFTKNEDGTYTSSNGNKYAIDYNTAKVTLAGEGSGEGEGTGTETTVIEPGAYVTYSGLNWRVLSANGDFVELITAQSFGSLSVGSSDVYNAAMSYDNFQNNLLTEIEEGLEPYGLGSAAWRPVMCSDVDTIRDLELYAANFWIYDGFGSLEPDEEYSNHYFCNYMDYEEYYYELIYSIAKSGLDEDDRAYGAKTKAVRAALTVGTVLFENATGDGSQGQPYVIGD